MVLGPVWCDLHRFGQPSDSVGLFVPPLPPNLSTMNQNFLIAAALAATAMLCWAGNWVLGRAVRADVPPLGLTFWRWALASAILLPFVALKLRGEWPAIRAGWKVVAVLAVLGAAMFQAMVYIGLHSTEAINALLLNTTAPLWVIIIARLVLGETVTARQVTGIVISFLGAAWLVARGQPARLLDLHFSIGDAWILAALVVWGLYSVMLKFRPPGVSPVVLTFCIALGGAALVLPLHLWEGTPMPRTAAALGSVVYTGIFASVVAFLAFNAAVARIGPSRTVFFLHLMPVFGAVLAMIFLGERLETYHLIGFPVALGGVLWATTGPVKAA